MADKASPPHLFADVLARVHAVCGALAAEGGWPAGIDLSRVVVEPPRDAAHGDMATNAAMVLAKEARAKPRDLAERSRRGCARDDLIASVDVAGPGFINLTLKPTAWSDALRTVLREGDSLRAKRDRRGREGQCRICLGQSDRADACRALPRRGVRRCAVQACWRSRAMTSRANITSTMPARRSMCSRARHFCDIARRWAKTSAPFRRGFIPAII